MPDTQAHTTNKQNLEEQITETKLPKEENFRYYFQSIHELAKLLDTHNKHVTLLQKTTLKH